VFENRVVVARSVIRCFWKPRTGGSIGHHVCSRDFCFCVCPCVDRCAPLLCSRCRCCSCSVPLRRSMCLPCAAVARGGLSRDACRAEPRSPHRDAPVALGRQEMGGRPGRAEVAPRWRPGCSRGQKKDSRRGVAVQARARRKAAQNSLLNLLVVARSAICSSASIAVSFSFVSVAVPPFCVRGPRGGHSVSPAVPVFAAAPCFFAS